LFLNNSSLGINYLKEHIEEIINKFQKDLDFVFKFMFNNLDECLELLKMLSLHSDLHIRYLFMKYLLEQKSKFISLFYDDITKYLTSETFQELEQLSLFIDYMDMKEVCELAYICFEFNIDYVTWEKFKEFILSHYRYNELAYRLLDFKKQFFSNNSYQLVKNTEGIEEFNNDADTLFLTSANYRLDILNRYCEKVSKELLDLYRQQLIYFQKDGSLDYAYERIEYYGLGRKLEMFVDKYLSLSSCHTHNFIGAGTTASCYRIGDYVFKLVKTKWSYEQKICPDLYIILPNLEEEFVRANNGEVLAGIEVQKYLSRSAKSVSLEILIKFRDELKRLGYYSTDSLINGPCGDNCMLLDNYLDSGNLNPPDWFKEYPLVLVDRDRVYKLKNRHPKQLRQY